MKNKRCRAAPTSLPRNGAAAKGEGGQKFLPPAPFLFARPSVRFCSCHAKRGNQRFCSKKVRAAFSNCDRLMVYQYLHIANAKELLGKDRVIFRILEIIPGFAAWVTLLGMVLASWLAPIAAAIFIILFDLYWLVKTIYLSVHLRGNWKRIMHNLKINWRERVDKLKWDHVWQVVILPFYKEPFEISDGLLASVAGADWPKDRMIIVLAHEERVGEGARDISKQPVPLYHNNIWEAPAFSRVVANSGSFWQMMQQERPERLATFSSHSMSFKALVEVDFWQKNMVSEDSRIFWQGLLRYKGGYKSQPLSYPVYMDANVGRNLWETIKNVYKHQRRWAWGAENFSYTVFGFIKIPVISLRKKLYFTMIMFEGLWSWATNAILMFFLGWLPLALGGEIFNSTILAFNLPRATRLIMTFAMVGIVTSILISTSLLPPPPEKTPKRKSIYMIVQWLLMPAILIIFGSIPALDAQTRLMLGRYMGFWVTPKFRKSAEIENRSEAVPIAKV